MQRYIVLFASLVIQICLGSIYAWSEFVPELKSEYGISTTQTQLIFGATIATFTVTMLFAGRLQDKQGPRIIAVIGSLFFGASYIFAAFSGGSFTVLLLTVGVLSGIGIGFGYVCPLATCVKWFPEHKGLITGISVAGFGAGAILMAELVEFCFLNNLHVLDVFFWIGIIYGVVLMISSLFLTTPAECRLTVKVAAPSLHRLIHEKKFLMMILGMFCGTFAGLLVIGNLKSLGLAAGLTSTVATAGIVAFAFGNALGRVLWGKYYDKVGAVSIFQSLLFISVSVASLLFVNGNSIIFLIVSMFIGLGFGSCFVLYATVVADSYGASVLGTIYPWIFLAYGISGIAGPVTGGWVVDVTGSYLPAIIFATCLTIFGAFSFRHYLKINVI
jgi:MFS transporter, OFA family, oxalate/formate antiporter